MSEREVTELISHMDGVMMLGGRQAIRTEGVMMQGAKRVVLAPSVNIRIDRPSGWTKAQPYENQPLPPDVVPSPDPGRIEGIMMLGAKRVVLAPSAITRLGQRSGWTTLPGQ